jgi:hypothetical protein
MQTKSMLVFARNQSNHELDDKERVNTFEFEQCAKRLPEIKRWSVSYNDDVQGEQNN